MFVSFSFWYGLPSLLVAHIQIFDTQENSSLETLHINGEIPVSKLRGDDEKCTKLDLSQRGYQNADAIIVASLIKVRVAFFVFNLFQSGLGYPLPGSPPLFLFVPV